MAKAITKKQVEAAAAAIGLVVGPPTCGGGPWSESYLPKVKWPDDYTELERERLRRAAADALFASRGLKD